MSGGFLLAYFLDEHDPDGEAVRFAVSEDDTPYRWQRLWDGAPVLRSTVGEGGARDPFLVRTADGFVLLATDLRVWPDQDWTRATRRGSRGVLLAHSSDLVSWSDFELVPLAPPEAGNTWAPKAFYSSADDAWLVFWASSLFTGADRDHEEHQRILVSRTRDFRTFGPARVHLDRGHDVIDLTFIEHDGLWYRFSVDQRVPGGAADLGHHPLEEVGTSPLGEDFRRVAEDVGKGVLERGEGPAVAAAGNGDRWYLLIDEFGLRGYQLFETDDLSTGEWTHRPDARLPEGARHGSLLAITAAERERLLEAKGEGAGPRSRTTAPAR